MGHLAATACWSPANRNGRPARRGSPPASRSMPPPGARSWPPANASASPPPKRWPPQACTEMRAIALQRFAPDGDTTALVMAERPQPAPPAAGEVLVRVKACSLNFRSEEHTTELKSLIRTSLDVFSL